MSMLGFSLLVLVYLTWGLGWAWAVWAVIAVIGALGDSDE